MQVCFHLRFSPGPYSLSVPVFSLVGFKEIGKRLPELAMVDLCKQFVFVHQKEFNKLYTALLGDDDDDEDEDEDDDDI